jgi:hypothetical protein
MMEVYETPEMRRRVAKLKKFYRICQAYSDMIEKWLADPNINEVERDYLELLVERLYDFMRDSLIPYWSEDVQSLKESAERHPEEPYYIKKYHFYKLFHQKLPEEEVK